jgi:O-antigen ligase
MTTVARGESSEAPRQFSEWVWLLLSVLLAVLLGKLLVEHIKVALAGVVLFLAVIVPILVIGARPRATVLLLIGILFLAPEISIAADLPRIIGDEVLLYITALMMIAARLTAADFEPAPPMPAAGKALLLFFPLTLLTIANGAARFGINPLRGDYFEFVKFGKYAIALYIASTVVVDRRFLRLFSWAVAGGGFLASVSAIMQSFNLLGARTFFEVVYYGANADKVSEYLSWRASGTIGNPNEFALFVAAGLAFAVTLLYMERRPGDRLWLLGFILADLLALILAGSRMGLLAGAIVVLAVVIRSGRRRRTAIVAALATVLFIAFVLFLAARGSLTPSGFLARALDPILNRAERFNPQHLGGIVFRLAMWKSAWSETQASLLLGYGPAKGATGLQTSSTVDSEIFMMALRYGLIGLTIWVGIWVVFLRTASRASKARDREAQLVGRALWAILFVNLLATTVNYTFLALRRMTLVCLAVGLAAAIVRADRERNAAGVNG